MVKTSFPGDTDKDDWLFESRSYLNAIRNISESIRKRTSVTILTGESGVGKTRLISQLKKNFSDDVCLVFLGGPHGSFAEMLCSVTLQMVETYENQNNLEEHAQIQAYIKILEQGCKDNRNVIIFLDDAQDVTEDTLLNLLGLLNREDDDIKSMQFVMSGLPQFRLLLSKPGISGMIAGKSEYFKLDSLNDDEVGEFILQRLSSMDIDKANFFTLDGITKISSYTGGIPSLVNILVDSILTMVEENKYGRITEDIVDKAVEFFPLPWAIGNNALVSENNISDASTATVISSQKKFPYAGVFRGQNFQKSTTEEDEEVFAALTEELSEYNQEANNSITTDELTSFDIFPAELRKKDPKDEVTNLTQAQILPENESLHKILLALQKQSTDIEAVALISEDGMMVASVVPEALDKNSIVRLSSALLSLGIRTSNEFDHGKVEQIIVHGEHGYTVMLRAGCSGAILLVITGEQAKLGLICFDMRNAFNNIETIL